MTGTDVLRKGDFRMDTNGVSLAPLQPTPLGGGWGGVGGGTLPDGGNLRPVGLDIKHRPMD